MQERILVALFLTTIILIAVEKWHRTVISLLSAALVIAIGYLTPQEAWNYIDFNTLGLLLGMMIIVSFFRRTGFFEFIAIKAIKFSGGSIFKLFFIFFMLTGVVSAFLDNVTTVLIFSPIIILVANILGISPFPFLVGEIIASNLGGTATLIGDPPNIIIGSAAGLSFNDFIINLTPIVLLAMISSVFLIKYLLEKEYKISGQFDVSLINLDEKRAIKNKVLLFKTLAIFGIVIIGFILHDKLHILPSIVALLGALLLLFIQNKNPEEYFHEVEWNTLFFFGGLFILIGALEKYHIIEYVANGLLKFSRGEFGLVLVISILALILTVFMGAIPFVVTMVPIIQTIIQKTPGINSHALWWTLSITSCFMGNATIIAAAANLVVSDISSKTPQKITFKNYLKYGLPITLFTFVLGVLYIFVRYFFFK